MTSGWDMWLTPPAEAEVAPARLRRQLRALLSSPKADPAIDASKFDFDKDMAKFADARALLECDRSQPRFVPRARRQAADVFRLGRHRAAAADGHRLLQKAVAANGADTPEFFRLFMVPGMFHCRGGVGPERLDGLTALINWVENGTAPATITATQVANGKPVRTRPLCPYPQVARYSGSGSPDDAANFACKAPE